jgi:hypothetical protein
VPFLVELNTVLPRYIVAPDKNKSLYLRVGEPRLYVFEAAGIMFLEVTVVNHEFAGAQ